MVCKADGRQLDLDLMIAGRMEVSMDVVIGTRIDEFVVAVGVCVRHEACGGACARRARWLRSERSEGGKGRDGPFKIIGEVLSIVIRKPLLLGSRS